MESAEVAVAYLRNRWYDPQTGRFLTQDPIGLVGGVNLYAYAGNNPVAFTDPFGLEEEAQDEAKRDTVSVACRDVELGGGDYQHCAVRVHNADTDATFELLPQGAGPYMWNIAGVTTDEQASRYSNWLRVSPVRGMSDKQFDRAVIAIAIRMSTERTMKRYSPLGGKNSNRYIYDILRAVGAVPPFASITPGKTAPGLCGGFGVSTGFNCRN